MDSGEVFFTSKLSKTTSILIVPTKMHNLANEVIQKLRSLSKDMPVTVSTQGVNAGRKKEIKKVFDMMKTIKSTQTQAWIISTFADVLEHWVEPNEESEASHTLLSFSKAALSSPPNTPDNPSRPTTDMELVELVPRRSTRQTTSSRHLAVINFAVRDEEAIHQPQTQTHTPTTAMNKRKRDVRVPPDSDKDDEEDQSEEMRATLQAIAATQADLTIELLRNTSNTSRKPSSMSFIQFSKLQSESDDHLFHRLSLLRPKMLQDWFLHSVLIVSIAAHHFPIDTVSRQKLEKFYSQHKQLGSSRAFYRHRGVFRFFTCLITLAQSLKVKDADFFITELLKHLETSQLQVAWVQKRVLEIIGQRLAQWSMDGKIVFDSRILFDSKFFNPKTLTGICKAEGCNGPATTEFCWYHSLAHQGVESRLNNMEGAGFTLYATKDLDVGTRFEYNGDRIDTARLKQRSEHAVQLNASTIIDSRDWHSYPMRYLTHAVRSEANCDWLVTPAQVYVSVVRPITKGEELTIFYQYGSKKYPSRRL
jgi:hypothetical protein